jgi:hypothetical protein
VVFSKHTQKLWSIQAVNSLVLVGCFLLSTKLPDEKVWEKYMDWGCAGIWFMNFLMYFALYSTDKKKE